MGEGILSGQGRLARFVIGGGCHADQMNGDEQLLNGRVYGADHGNPNPGPLPHRTYAELVGGPLDIHGWRTEEVDDGVAQTTELSRWPGGRALYDPRPSQPRTPGPGLSCRFYYSGDTP